MDFNTFDVLYVDMGLTKGSVQGKSRPVVLVQNDVGNMYAPTLIVIPLTHVIKKTHQPTHGILKQNKKYGLPFDSMLLAEQVVTINKTDVISKIGNIYDDKGRREVTRCYIANLVGNKKCDLMEV